MVTDTVVAGRVPAQRDPDLQADRAAAAWALVERTQAGDADAWAEIWCRYRETVSRFVYYRVRNWQLAEDLTSDTFERALKRIGSFTWQGRDFGAWLVTIARNLIADHFKSGRYRLEVVVGNQVDPSNASTSTRTVHAPDAADETLRAEVARTMRDGLLQLTAEQREVLQLRFWAGLTVLETAARLGITEGACKAAQYRAVRALSQLRTVKALDPARSGGGVGG